MHAESGEYVPNKLHLAKGVDQQGMVGEDIQGLKGQAMSEKKASDNYSRTDMEVMDAAECIFRWATVAALQQARD